MNKINNFKLIISNSQDGFTLIEAVVSTAVFAFIFSSIVGVYISTVQLDRKTRAQRAVTETGRFISEFLTKEIRNGAIDYASYSGSRVPSTNYDLYIINQAGEQEHIYPSTASCTASTPCNLFITKNGSTANLNPASTKVTNFQIYVQPLGNSYVDTTFAEQPRVTLIIELSSVGRTASDTAKIDIQTTISTRVYPSLP